MSPVLSSLPVLILYPHSRCNCRCIMCDIWKTADRAEISAEQMERHLADIERLSVRWVVLSGGEPLMHSDLFRLCALLRSRKIRITLLSTGLLLERHAERLAREIDDVIVSVDGPPAVHDAIRRVLGAFASLERGVRAIYGQNPEFPIAARCTVQRANFQHLRATAQSAWQLGLRSISFLAADLSSEAFNRMDGWSAERQSQIALSETEIELLDQEFHLLSAEWAGSGFVLESPQKLERIVHHFRAHLGLCRPLAPVCNAPWVSAVVESNGVVRPCFFHRPIGSVKDESLFEVLNGLEAIRFRSELDVASNPICRRCVCSLNYASNVGDS